MPCIFKEQPRLDHSVGNQEGDVIFPASDGPSKQEFHTAAHEATLRPSAPQRLSTLGLMFSCRSKVVQIALAENVSFCKSSMLGFSLSGNFEGSW